MLQTSISTVAAQVLTEVLAPWPIGTMNINGNVPEGLLLKYVLGSSKNYKGFQEYKNKLHKLTKQYIRRIRQDPEVRKRKDMIANFLNSSATSNMNDDELLAVVLNLTLAGRDTTACLLSWMFYLLTQNPEVQKRLIEEIDEKLKGQQPTLKDLDADNMPYLNGMIYETLRLYPPVPSDEKYATSELVYLDGTRIPKGTKLVFSPFAMGRNPSVYPDPLKVDPNRWIPFKPPSLFAFPVFQAGPRFCLGKDMAQFEAKLLASTLLQHFTFTMEESEAKNITYALALTISVCNSKTQDSHNLWITPHARQ
mmetsp:Transcript_1132/g.1629  ORF Transcript_1132/g.1629 Transcript_1132/m.1629 type:complete len:309 (+) Transcript_1132:959-1885(+)